MDLIEKLVTTPQREKAGSLAQDRFDFQAHWGITHLLDLHEQGIDYNIAFEFHDDIFVIVYVSGAPKVRFFQVKTKNAGFWTIDELTRREKGKNGTKPSVIGKMLTNKIKFPDETDHLGFVSNVPAIFISKPYPCKISETQASDYVMFVTALKNEFPRVACDADGDLFHFHKTDFSLEKYETFLKGRVLEFVQNTCGMLASGHDGFRLALLDHCRDRSKNMDDITSFEQLLTAKFIRRSDMDGWIEGLKLANQRKPPWSDAQPLIMPFLSPARLRIIRQQWEKYETDRLKVTDVGLHELRSTIRSALDSYLETNQEASMEKIMTDVPNIVHESVRRAVPHLSDSYIYAGVLYEFQASHEK